MNAGIDQPVCFAWPGSMFTLCEMQRQKSFVYSLKLCVCKPFSFHDGTMKMIVDIGKGTKF